MTLIVDASVALKCFLPDGPNAAEALTIARTGTPLIAPDILVAEGCNAAWRSARLGRIGQRQVTEIAVILPRFFDALVGAGELAPRAVNSTTRFTIASMWRSPRRNGRRWSPRMRGC